MAEDRTAHRAPPVRTLLHRDLPEPLPPRIVWPARVVLWMPVLAGMMITLPLLSMLFYPEGEYSDRNHLRGLPVVIGLLAGLGALSYELVALVRRRRRRTRRDQRLRSVLPHRLG